MRISDLFHKDSPKNNDREIFSRHEDLPIDDIHKVVKDMKNQGFNQREIGSHIARKFGLNAKSYVNAHYLHILNEK